MFEKLLSGPVATITCRHFTFLHGSSLPMFAKLLMKLLDIFNVTSGHFPAGYFNGTAGIRVTFNMFGQMWWQNQIFLTRYRDNLLVYFLMRQDIVSAVSVARRWIFSMRFWEKFAAESCIFLGLFAVEKQVFLMKRWGIFLAVSVAIHLVGWVSVPNPNHVVFALNCGRK